MTEPLSRKQCTPCQGGIPPLSPDQAAEYLDQVPEWELFDGHTRLRRSFKFQDFRGSLAFVQRAAELAETEGHHPVITFGWGFVTIELQTKKIKGLHENDFIMAAKLDDLYRTGAPPC